MRFTIARRDIAIRGENKDEKIEKKMYMRKTRKLENRGRQNRQKLRKSKYFQILALSINIS